jgi:hypothetical protein
VLRAPVIAWIIRLDDNGGTDGLRPVTACMLPSDPELAWAIGWPDGRVYAASCIFWSVEEWLFAIRRTSCTHQVEGTA